MKRDSSTQEMIEEIKDLESELSSARKTENRLNSLFNNMSEGVCLHEVIYDSDKKPVDYRIIEVNPAYEKITNIKKEDAVNKNASVVYGTSEAPFLDIFSRVADTGVPESLEVYWPPMNKHFNISVFSPEKGQFATVFMDITRQKEQEEALRESEALLKSTFRAAPTGIGLVSERRLVEVNDKFCEITGYSKEELLNQNSRILYPDDADYEYVGKEKYRQINLYGTGTVETRFKRKDGKIIDILMSSTPLDLENLKAGVTFTALDITDRRMALEALSESEKKYRRLTENSPDMIYRMSLPDGRYEYVSSVSEKLTGYKPDEWYQDTLLIKKILHPDWQNYFKEKWELLLEGDIPPSYEYQIIHRNGESRWLNQRNIVVTDDNGKPVAIEGIVTDITDRKMLETQLVQSQKMESIGTLAGGIAHDFNNILSPIMISAELAMMNLPEDDPVQDDLKSIYRAGERARDLVRQILTFARKSDDQRVKLHATTLIKDVLKFLRSTIPTTIDIQYQIETRNDIILADKTRLNQVVMNLFTNAAHAMKEKGGTLKITIADIYFKKDTVIKHIGLKSGHYLKLSVSDTGTGIPHKIQDKIFEPYFTTKAPGEGTGMGLAVVHGIVKNYEGEITVESTAGKGTTFNVYLPIVDEEILDTDPSESNLLFGSERILYIDDEVDLIHPVKAMLEKLGYTVTADNSSIHALEFFKNNPNDMDIVITDQTMPDMTGRELAAELKSIRPDIPIILCTGYSDQINEENARTMGISAFLLKPIIMRDISRTIREILDGD